jgi:hypothetical protein
VSRWKASSSSRVLVSVSCQVAVGAVNHLHARAHPPRERGDIDAGGQAPRRVRVAQVVDAAMADTGCLERRTPLALTPVVDGDTASRRRGEEDAAPRTGCSRVPRRRGRAAGYRGSSRRSSCSPSACPWRTSGGC